MAATNGTPSQQEQYTNTASAAETASGNANGSAELSKDEIGWYFVEQYYTTLSKSPEKLHVCSFHSLYLVHMLIRTALLRQAFAIRLWPRG